MKSDQSTISGGGAAGGSGGTAGLGRSGLGGSGLGTSGGQRLPVAPRERRPALAALAVLLILGGALASAYLVMASGERVPAIRIAKPVAAGQQIPADALQEVQVGDTGVQFISWSERARVTQRYAAVPLVEGALLTNAMLVRPADEPLLDRVTVGLALKPGQLPSGDLHGGRHVVLYAVGGAQGGGPRAGTVLTQDAIVVAVGAGDGGGPTRLRSEQVAVDVAIRAADAAKVTQAASAGAVAIALLPPGAKTAAAPPDKPAGTDEPGGVDPVPGGGTGNGNDTGNGTGTGPAGGGVRNGTGGN